MAARVSGLLSKEKERRNRLKELEIDYDFTGFQAIIESQPKGKAKAKPAAKAAEPVATPAAAPRKAAKEEKETKKEEPKKAGK